MTVRPHVLFHRPAHDSSSWILNVGRLVPSFCDGERHPSGNARVRHKLIEGAWIYRLQARPGELSSDIRNWPLSVMTN